MEKYKIQKPDPEIALKLLSYTGIRKLGYHNNKNFCIKAIKNKHRIYEDLSYTLRNDIDILNATIENEFDMSFVWSIPKRHQNQKVLDQLIDSNLDIGYERLESIIDLFGSLSQREKNILKGIKKIKSPLKTPYEKYQSNHYMPGQNPYPLINKKTGNKISLFDKYFICLGDHMFDRADAYDPFQDNKFKMFALSLSPAAAFEFLLNSEITESQFAEIFANHFIKYTSRGYFNNMNWARCSCDACMGLRWKKFAPKDPKKELRLKKTVIEHILMKTKSLHKICVFLHFNEEFHIPGIINILKKRLSIKHKNTTLLENIRNTYHYGELIVDDELKTRNCLNRPKLLAEKFIDNHVYGEFNKLFIRESEQDIYLEDIDEEVFVNKAFIKNILPAFKKSYFDSESLTKKDVWLSQTAAKYINKFKDLKVLKQIIYFQSQEPSKVENIMKYIQKNIKKEIIEYYLIQNYALLPYSHVETPKLIVNEAYIKKIETEFSIKRDVHFYTKLVNAYGINAFKDSDNRCYIPEEYKNNKDFMTNAVLKSYKTLRHASDNIKSDPDVIYIAYLKSIYSFKSASKTLKKDKQFLDSLFSNPITKFHKAHYSIKTDKDICVPAINSNINVVKDLSIRMIKKLNMNWFSEIQRDRIFKEYVRKSGTDDVFLIAAKKHEFSPHVYHADF